MVQKYEIWNATWLREEEKNINLSLSSVYLKGMNKSKVSKNEPLLKTLFAQVVGKDSSV